MLTMLTSVRLLRGGSCGRAFVLVEALVAIFIVGIVFVALYAGITSGVGTARLDQEDLTAAQILEEKFEVLRLYNWDQINSNSFIPTNFAILLPTSSTNVNKCYTGTVTIADTTLTESYANNLKLVTVQLQWQNGDHICTRSMSSFVARNGLQSYVY